MNCKQCNQSFEVTEEDRKFYEAASPIYKGKKYLIPDPTLCPDCRAQRRLAFRNERNLYHRKSDLSGKPTIAMYSADKLYPVYTQEEWWSDAWDGLDYGMEYDFKRPFFEQFKELFGKVPRIALINKEHDNSEFCNFAWRNRNSYLLFTSSNNQDSFYGNRCWDSRNIVDCTNVVESEICYECVDCEKCYNGKWLQACSNCQDCTFGFDNKNCKNCFACAGLRGREYCIGNVQMTKDQYLKAVEDLKKNPKEILKRFEEHKRKLVRKYYNGQNIQDSTGDNLFNAIRCESCFSVNTAEDCKYVNDATHMKSSYDVNNDDHSELVYEVCGSESNYHCLFHDICWFDSDITYCSLCFNSKNLFGCIGLKKNEYCILNKQYSKAEYEELVPRIIEQMQKNGEWGEYFPVTISPFAYNETVAAEYFPLTQSEVKKRGWNWYEDSSARSFKGPSYAIPSDISEVKDDITTKILASELSGKPYKIIPQELKFYRENSIPVPRLTPDERYIARLQKRNARKLWDRKCGKCGASLKTSYPLDRPETVYCEECYLKEVY